MCNAVYQSCGSKFVDVISTDATLVDKEIEPVQMLNISRHRVGDGQMDIYRCQLLKL